MREKKLQLVVTFHTTADAMAMEQACKEQHAPGRLIPVPRAISAGCGLAWCAGPECRETLKEIMQSTGIREEDMHECMV
ncbi:MAG: DUF3343 domain-containing protein [Ruminococcus sp.]|jgi:hypothetical protein|nr:DUF3343 domain-containing protein [Ruminococcus sp.]